MRDTVIFQNREFLADLDSGGHAIRSIVYCAGVATFHVYEWMYNGLLREWQQNYPAEKVPVIHLKDKFRVCATSGAER